MESKRHQSLQVSKANFIVYECENYLKDYKQCTKKIFVQRSQMRRRYKDFDKQHRNMVKTMTSLRNGQDNNKSKNEERGGLKIN